MNFHWAKVTIFLLLAALVVQPSAFAQSNNVEQLKKELSQLTQSKIVNAPVLANTQLQSIKEHVLQSNDVQLITEFHVKELFVASSLSQFDDAIELAEQALLFRRKNSMLPDRNLAIIYDEYAYALDYKGLGSQALIVLYKGLNVAKQINATDKFALSSVSIAEILLEQGKEIEALEYAKQAYAASIDNTDHEFRAQLFNNLGLFYSYLGNVDVSTEFYRLGLEEVEQSSDQGSLGIALFNYAHAFIDRKEFIKAESLLLRMFDTEGLEQNTMLLFAGLMAMTKVQLALEKNSAADTYFEKATELVDKIESPFYRVEFYLLDAQFALDNEDARHGLSSLDTAVGITLTIDRNENDYIQRIRRLRSALLEANGSPDEALQALKRYTEVLEASIDEVKQKHITDLSVELGMQAAHNERLLNAGKLVMKDRVISEYRVTEQRNHLIQLALVAAIVVLLGVLFFQIRRSNQSVVIRHIDDVTGLNNRRYIFDLGQKRFASSSRLAEPLSLMIIRVDNFKQIHYQYGTERADSVLKQVAEVMSRQLRQPDMLSRISGDEFLIMLPGVDEARANNIQVRMQSTLRQDSFLALDCGLVSIKIGVSTKLESTQSFEQLVEAADLAMRVADLPPNGVNSDQKITTFRPKDVK